MAGYRFVTLWYYYVLLIRMTCRKTIIIVSISPGIHMIATRAPHGILAPAPDRAFLGLGSCYVQFYKKHLQYSYSSRLLRPGFWCTCDIIRRAPKRHGPCHDLPRRIQIKRRARAQLFKTCQEAAAEGTPCSFKLTLHPLLAQHGPRSRR